MERAFISGHRAAAVADGARVTPEKIVAAVEQIVAVAHPLRVIAFGSRARGDHHEESDLDLAIIVDACDSMSGDRAVRRSDIDVFMSIDLLRIDEERYEFMKDSIISVEHQIEQDGVILYDASTGSIDLGAARRLAG